MSEKGDWKLLRDKIRYPRDRWDRMENAVGVGMPDINYCIEGAEGWVEMKSPSEPQRDSTPLFGSNHKLSQDQKNWFKRQLDAKGRVYILIRTERFWMLIHGQHADGLNEMTMAELIEVADWIAANPVRDKLVWAHLREVLAR